VAAIRGRLPRKVEYELTQDVLSVVIVKSANIITFLPFILFWRKSGITRKMKKVPKSMVLRAERKYGGNVWRIPAVVMSGKLALTVEQ
jgi:hypothetical protein